MSDAPNIVVGQPMSDAQKADMAKYNAEETTKAHELAAQHRARDAMNEPPLVNALADSIKEKLEALPPEEDAQTNV